MKLNIIILLCTIALCCAIQKRDICQSDECDESCDGNDCNYCSGSTCCETSQCNRCVNSCRSSCSRRSCARGCVNSCSEQSSCDSCTTKSCHNDCKKSQSNQSNNSTTSAAVNVTTVVDLKNSINNTNYINNPIWVNSTNINNIKVEFKSGGYFSNGTTKYTEGKDCCVVVPPKQCYYNHTELECKQNPYKICSDACKTPVVVPHPVPVDRPYPVPYPVHHVKHVYVPQREPVYIPMQQPCPMASYGGSYYPTCRDADQSQYYTRTQQPFLIDPHYGAAQGQLSPFCKFSNQYPYYTCNNVQLQQCGGCLTCNNQYNPRQCSSSSSCSEQCRQSLSHLNLEGGNFGNMINCSQTPDGRVVCR